MIFPGFLFAEDGVEDAEQFPHTGDESDLFAFAGTLEVLVMGSDDRVMLRGDERGHVQGRANGRSASPGRALPTPLSAVTVDWCHADQGSDLLPRVRKRGHSAFRASSERSFRLRLWPVSQRRGKSRVSPFLLRTSTPIPTSRGASVCSDLQPLLFPLSLVRCPKLVPTAREEQQTQRSRH